MSQFEFDLATQEDDAGLRKLLAETPMAGEIALAFAREPSYFAASAVDGRFVQVVIARDRKSQRIVGMGSRAVSSCYVNGRPADVGYLNALRLLPEYRGRAALLARGFRLFRELHADRRVPFYLTTIAADNRMALDLLTSQRAGLPVYHPLGRYHTLTLSAAACPKPAPSAGISVRKSTPSDREPISTFLHKEGLKRQFFPEYDAAEFFECPRRLLGLRPESVLLAFMEDRLVGTLGIWDQRNFKQITVCDYSKWIRLGRPLYNSFAALRSKPKLPNVGEPVNLRCAAIPVIARNDPRVVAQLFHAAMQDLRAQDCDLLTIGLHEADPLLPLFRPYSGREYTTMLYLVYWPDEVPDVNALTQRIPYLELGCL